MPKLAIMNNNTSIGEMCAVCGKDVRQDIGPELFLAGTFDPVCHECGEKFDPSLMAGLAAARAHWHVNVWLSPQEAAVLSVTQDEKPF